MFNQGGSSSSTNIQPTLSSAPHKTHFRLPKPAATMPKSATAEEADFSDWDDTEYVAQDGTNSSDKESQAKEGTDEAKEGTDEAKGGTDEAKEGTDASSDEEKATKPKRVYSEAQKLARKLKQRERYPVIKDARNRKRRKLNPKSLEIYSIPDGLKAVIEEKKLGLLAKYNLSFGNTTELTGNRRLKENTTKK
ncbi:hypothetical protein HK100_010455, partial [Physocladia obscura]